MKNIACNIFTAFFFSRNPRRQGQIPVNFHDIPFVKDWLSMQWVSPVTQRRTHYSCYLQIQWLSRNETPVLFEICLWPFGVSWSPGSCQLSSVSHVKHSLISRKITHTNIHIHQYMLRLVLCRWDNTPSCFVSCHTFSSLSFSPCLQSQASHPSVSAAERGSGCSAHPGFLEGIQGTLDMTAGFLFTSILKD